MNKRAITAIAVIAVLLVGGAIAVIIGSRNNESTDADNQPSDSAVSQAVNQVAISNFAFSPKTITVKVGTTVTWTNNDSVEHDVVADDDSAGGPKSELLGKGEMYSFTFQKAGTYNYHCTPHPNMQGTVVVTE